MPNLYLELAHKKGVKKLLNKSQILRGFRDVPSSSFLYFAWNSRWNSQKLAKDLRAARLNMTPEEWISTVYFNSVLSTSIYTIVILLLFIIFNLFLFLYFLLPIPLIFVISWILGIKHPRRKAKARAVNIDLYLFYATNYLATMSSSGIAPWRDI